MSLEDRWLLPEGIEELLPPQAARVERLRRELLDLFDSWGYELVITPMVEYLESLLTGTGHDLDLQTFKLTDQVTGRLMGLRADMTPQVARIDAHNLKREGPTRLCYLGTVVHTRANGFAGSRTPLQVGAELYGHPGLESDVEVLCLLLETLHLARIDVACLDLGHVGIVRGLLARAGLGREREEVLFDVLERKAAPEMAEHLDSWALPEALKTVFRRLLDLNGAVGILDEARAVLSDAGEEVRAALDDLATIARLVEQRAGPVDVHLDLAELRGYHYHTGVMFAAYAEGQGQAVARGGRYDDIGSVFGRARPATGFSTDLRTLIALGPQGPAPAGGIVAPWDGDAVMEAEIKRLRAGGERVIRMLPGQPGDARDMQCDRRLILQDGRWRVVPN